MAEDIAASRGHLEELDAVRALAVLAVVLNHIPYYSFRQQMGMLSPDFGNLVIQITNFISIPPFMLTAGILLGLGRKEVNGLGGYVGFVRRKALRLMLPFVSVSVLHMIVKLSTATLAPSQVPAAVMRSLAAPRDGLAGHLWFLYCLMSIFLLWPLLAKVGRVVTLSALTAGLFVLAILPIPWPVAAWAEGNPLLGLKDLVWFAPIFMLGYSCATRFVGGRRPGWGQVLALAAIVAASFWVAMLTQWPAGFGWRAIRQVILMIGNVAAACCLLAICSRLTYGGTWPGRLLAAIGRRSYDIYLLHVALVGYPVVFLLSKLHPGVEMTYVFFVLATLVTYFVPIGLGELIRRVPALSLVILGVGPGPRARPQPK